MGRRLKNSQTTLPTPGRARRTAISAGPGTLEPRPATAPPESGMGPSQPPARGVKNNGYPVH